MQGLRQAQVRALGQAQVLELVLGLAQDVVRALGRAQVLAHAQALGLQREASLSQGQHDERSMSMGTLM